VIDSADLRHIAASDAARWQVLHRVDAGRLFQAEPGKVWVDRGRLLASHLQPTVRLLLDEQLVRLVEDHPTPRLALSDAGARRLAALTDQRVRAQAARWWRPRLMIVADGRRGERMSLLWFGSVAVLTVVTAVRIALTVRRSGGTR
jgi:hypothetical protein